MNLAEIWMPLCMVAIFATVMMCILHILNRIFNTRGGSDGKDKETDMPNNEHPRAPGRKGRKLLGKEVRGV